MDGFGVRVRRAREALRLSQVAVSKASGVAQTTISKIERGEMDADEAVAVVRYASVLSAVGLAPSPGAPAATAPAPQKAADAASAAASAAVEDAVGRAFAPGVHRAGDMAPVLAEAASVLEVFGPEGPDRDHALTEASRLWLDAAAELRRRGLAVTSRTLLAQTTLLSLARKSDS